MQKFMIEDRIRANAPPPLPVYGTRLPFLPVRMYQDALEKTAIHGTDLPLETKRIWREAGYTSWGEMHDDLSSSQRLALELHQEVMVPRARQYIFDTRYNLLATDQVPIEADQRLDYLIAIVLLSAEVRVGVIDDLVIRLAIAFLEDEMALATERGREPDILYCAMKAKHIAKQTLWTYAPADDAAKLLLEMFPKIEDADVLKSYSEFPQLLTGGQFHQLADVFNLHLEPMQGSREFPSL